MKNECAELGEIDDLIRELRDPAFRNALEQQIEADVLDASLFLVPSWNHAQERGHASVHSHAAGGGLQIAGDDLKKRALAGAIRPDDPDTIALAHRQVDVAQGPERLVPDASEQDLL